MEYFIEHEDVAFTSKTVDLSGGAPQHITSSVGCVIGLERESCFSELVIGS